MTAKIYRICAKPKNGYSPPLSPLNPLCIRERYHKGKHQYEQQDVFAAGDLVVIKPEHRDEFLQFNDMGGIHRHLKPNSILKVIKVVQNMNQDPMHAQELVIEKLFFKNGRATIGSASGMWFTHLHKKAPVTKKESVTEKRAISFDSEF